MIMASHSRNWGANIDVVTCCHCHTDPDCLAPFVSSFIHAVYAEEHAPRHHTRTYHVASPPRRRPHECCVEESPHRSFVAETVCDVTIDEMPTVDRLVKPTVSSENSLAGGRVKRKSAHDTSGSQLARVLQTHKSYHAVRAPKRARGGALALPTMST